MLFKPDHEFRPIKKTKQIVFTQHVFIWSSCARFFSKKDIAKLFFPSSTQHFLHLLHRLYLLRQLHLHHIHQLRFPPFFCITYLRRRKFRSQISDNMDRWQCRGGKRQRRERQEKKIKVSKKVDKTNTVFFQCFAPPEGRKVCSLKRQVRSHQGRWEMKKMHVAVAQSTFQNQNE